MNWIEQFAPRPYFGWLALDVIAQLTGVTLVAAILAATVLKRSAAARHRLWLCSLACILISPVAAIALDRAGITLEVIPWSAGSASADAISVEPVADVAWEPSADRSSSPVQAPIREAHESATEPAAESFEVPASFPPPSTPIEFPPANRSTGPLPAPTTEAAPNPIEAALGALVLLWLLGVAIGLVRLGLAWRSLSRLRRSLEPLGAGDHADVLDEVRRALGLVRLPAVYTSTAISGPVAIGIARGSIVLPSALVASLTPGQLRDVLVHEMAHVLRWDTLVALLQRVAAVFYWPHPLVHWLNAHLARSREEVCDNFVLRLGDPCEYARTLLQISEGLVAARAQHVGLALADRRWTLSDRISGILDPQRLAVTAIKPWPAAALAFALGATCMAIGAARPITAEPHPKDNSAGTGQAKQPERAVRGLVVDEKGQPVANVSVFPARREKLIEPAKTSAHGSFRLALGGMMFVEEEIVASADHGRLMGLGKFVEPKSADIAAPVRIVLKPSRATKVHVRDEKGNPVSDATVVARGFDYDGEATTDRAGDSILRVPGDAEVRWLVAKKAGAGFDYFENARSVGADEVGPLPPEAILTLDGSRLVRIRAIDTAGRAVSGVEFTPWTIAKPGKLHSANIGGAPGLSSFTDRSGEATFDWLPRIVEEDLPFLIVPKDYSCPNSPVYRSGADGIVLEARLLRHTQIAGVVRHADGRPAAGILIRAEGHGGTNHYCRLHTRTAGDGSYTLDVYPDQSYMIAVLDEHWAARTLSGVIVREGLPQSGLDLTLLPGTLIHGVVTSGPRGSLAKGSTITLIEQGPVLPQALKARAGGRPNSSLPQWTTTDELGRYRFRVGPGQYRIRSDGGGATEIVESQAEIVHDLRVGESSTLETLSGTAIEKTAQGERIIPGAMIEVAPVGQNGLVEKAVANANGLFELAVKSPGPRTILTRGPNGSIAGFTRVGTNMRQLIASASPASRILGRVLDDDGRAVSGRRVQLFIDSSPKFETSSRFHSRSATDAAGHYEFVGIPIGANVQVVVPIEDGPPGHLKVENVVVRGSDPIEMPDIIVRTKKENVAGRPRTMPPPGAASYQPVAPTRAACEALLREIGREPVTPEMIDHAWLLSRPQFRWQSNVKDIREAFGEPQMIEWIDETARQLTGRPADSLTVFQGALEYGAGWYDEIVREKITRSRADAKRTAITVRGTVVEAETGKPIAGAIVYASDGLSRTDSAGRFQLETRAPQAKGMIWVEADGFALSEYPALLNTGKQPDVRISLGREELIGGLVVGPDGRPIAKATVTANFKHFEFRAPNAGTAPGGSSFGFPIETLTGADGRFVMRGLPRGLRIDWWEVRHPGFQTREANGDTLSATQLITVTLSPGCVVSGVLVDESGRSISGADVQIRSPSSAGSNTRLRTNLDGRFRFGNVSPGRWTVFVQPLRHAPVHGTIVASPTRAAESQFVVGPSSYISGRVIGTDGSPIEGAAVGWAKPINQRGEEIAALEINRTTRTAKDGTFRFGPIAQGSYALTGLAEQPRRIGYVTASANAVDALIRLEPEKKR